MRIANCAIHNNQTSNQLYADLCVISLSKWNYKVSMYLFIIYFFSHLLVQFMYYVAAPKHCAWQRVVECFIKTGSSLATLAFSLPRKDNLMCGRRWAWDAKDMDYRSDVDAGLWPHTSHTDTPLTTSAPPDA